MCVEKCGLPSSFLSALVLPSGIVAMQAAGSLRKRRRRNLAKVTGLGLHGYEEGKDRFDVNRLYRGGGMGDIWDERGENGLPGDRDRLEFKLG